MKYIHEWIDLRIQHAAIYKELLNKNNDTFTTPLTHKYAKHVFHLYVLRTKNRDGLREFLDQQGVSTGVHYPNALPYLNAYKYLKHTPIDFPVAYSHTRKIVSLPMYPELTKKMIKHVARNIIGFF